MNREEKRVLLEKVTAVSRNLVNDAGLFEHKVIQTDHDIEGLQEIMDDLHNRKENVYADDYQAFNIVDSFGEFMLHVTGAVAKLEHKVAALKMALEAVNEATAELNFAANKIPGIPLNE